MAKKTIKIKCYDEILELEEEAAFMSPIIKLMILRSCRDSTISLRNVTSRIMSKVIEYCNKHCEEEKWRSIRLIESVELKNWDRNFVREVRADMEMVYSLIEVAYYLKIESLLNLLCKSVADTMRGKSADEIRRLFNIRNNCNTRQELQEVRKDNHLA